MKVYDGRQWFLAIAGMMVVIPMAQMLGRYLGNLQNQIEGVQQSSLPRPTFDDVRVLVARQPSEGITEADFSPTYLKILETWTVEGTVANAKKYWDAASVPDDQRVLSGESLYIEHGKHKLAIVRIRLEDSTPNAVIFGVVGDELVRIACVKKGKGNVTISDGPCYAKIMEVFGDPDDPLGGAVG